MARSRFYYRDQDGRVHWVPFMGVAVPAFFELVPADTLRDAHTRNPSPPAMDRQEVLAQEMAPARLRS